MSILVVEDDRALMLLLQALLRRKSMTVQTVSRGEEALAAIDSNPSSYEAIVLDLMLPGVNGFEVIREIQATHPHLLSRVIVLTAVSSPMLGTLPFRDAVWGIIRKPFDLDHFVNALLECIACNSGRAVPTEAISRCFACRSGALGAKAGVLTIAQESSLHLKSEFGFPPGLTNGLFSIALDCKYPITTAFRSCKPVWFASLNLARAEYPTLLPIWTSGGSQAIAALPLVTDGVVVGAIGWSFDQPQRFDEQQRQELVGISAECLAILNRDFESSADSQHTA